MSIPDYLSRSLRTLAFDCGYRRLLSFLQTKDQVQRHREREGHTPRQSPKGRKNTMKNWTIDKDSEMDFRALASPGKIKLH